MTDNALSGIAAVCAHLGLPPAPPPYSFTPHVTLGFCDDKAELRRAEVEITATLTPVTFRAERAAHLIYRPGRTWQLVAELAFIPAVSAAGEVAP